ncbi:hypothetical protein ASD24_24320 [Paenibacillus sp. Root52]|uniref:hypothetical protein n=1 Tax=Paenibacillus sp. Root52 TaxID=1736552 RepID=UPI0006FEA74E|nr:hypothetical protein [Paenibacillus sp. Root52]KQY90927.1 hypothetical protein ASD24_24320 [Paenibacillus sp. Root52]
MNIELYTDKKEILIHAPELESQIRHELNPFAFLLNQQLIAYGEIAILEDRSLEIKMLQVIEEKRGYGRIFVDYLKTIPGIKELWGEALPEAVPFWQKVGASFDPMSYEHYLNNNDKNEEGFLVPFTIKQYRKGDQDYDF